MNNLGHREEGILLLDEVTSNVDTDTERIIKDLIEREFKAYTVLMITHRTDMVVGCDRVIVIDNGHTPVELGYGKRK